MWTWKHTALQGQNGLPGHCIEIIVIVVTPYVNLKTHCIEGQNGLPGHCSVLMISE